MGQYLTHNHDYVFNSRAQHVKSDFGGRGGGNLVGRTFSFASTLWFPRDQKWYKCNLLNMKGTLSQTKLIHITSCAPGRNRAHKWNYLFIIKAEEACLSLSQIISSNRININIYLRKKGGKRRGGGEGKKKTPFRTFLHFMSGDEIWTTSVQVLFTTHTMHYHCDINKLLQTVVGNLTCTFMQISLQICPANLPAQNSVTTSTNFCKLSSSSSSKKMHVLK